MIGMSKEGIGRKILMEGVLNHAVLPALEKQVNSLNELKKSIRIVKNYIKALVKAGLKEEEIASIMCAEVVEQADKKGFIKDYIDLIAAFNLVRKFRKEFKKDPKQDGPFTQETDILTNFVAAGQAHSLPIKKLSFSVLKRTLEANFYPGEGLLNEMLKFQDIDAGIRHLEGMLSAMEGENYGSFDPQDALHISLGYTVWLRKVAPILC